MAPLRTILAALSVLTLTACADSVADTQLRTIVVDGEPYTLRTRIIEGPNGPYETTSARVRNTYYPCKLDSPGDCAAAVRFGRDYFPADRE
ncbi:YgdI/YgdR family lipoprotein [Roseobacter sinensis]|uniref:YgdI/YgdR family lipoprotein n=1 Tax=Roseobacter sinensis TaxID=2931391 RepID=A0ABT3BAF0_9RHOB|nr:YgdI/YgdR family lipoprotein [Roseobacter sp. WL0113]MCV3270553.1 YgdI/YgdR family lipoprotein [Roseobacter sp. WL0113]